VAFDPSSKASHANSVEQPWLSALQLDPKYAGGVGAPALMLWRDWIGRSLRAMADGHAVTDPHPDGAVPDALARLARQIELMDGAVRRISFASG